MITYTHAYNINYIYLLLDCLIHLYYYICLYYIYLNYVCLYNVSNSFGIIVIIDTFNIAYNKYEYIYIYIHIHKYDVCIHILYLSNC